ncbi:MFS transporter [Kitasatospora acidiphila]|uniref:MFS transporter n=1 Tax=Kitasatospora acidiphila TaxID=2567942 RepID=A0A540W500_9ACTN|nr:MFS transporter [Kitasatospora acidiphila]TQF04119.1 MFS transporter [Kitasatospora acidiphila]
MAHTTTARPTAPTAPAATAAPPARRWLTLPVILLATFMASFDYMVVNVAAPALAHDLHAGQAALELVVGGYGFSYAAGLITGGKLGDLFGHRRMFLLGITAFTAASLLCGVAGSPGQLVGARLLQGLAAAAMAPQVLALITALFPAQERPRAISWFGVALGVGGIAGQVLGGLLLQADPLGLGWRVIFLVNLPVGAVAVPLAACLLPRSRPTARPRLDPLGVLGLSGALGLALVPLVLGRQQGWPLWTWLSLAAALPVLVATIAWERRLTRAGREPLLDLALFRGRSFTVGLLVNACMLAAIGSQMFTVTLLLQSGLGLDSRAAGLEFLPLGLATMAASLLGRRLTARYGHRVLVAGTLISTVAAAVVAVLLQLSGGAVPPPALALPLALTGLGNGLALPALMGAVLATVAPQRIGAASGVLTTTQQFSGAIGVAGVGAVFFAVLGPRVSADGYAGAAEAGMWCVAGLMAAASVLVGVLVRAARPSSS